MCLLSCRSIHWHTKMLLAGHLTRKLKLLTRLTGSHLALWHLEVLHLTLWQHSHADILLMCGSKLVLLCLQNFNLLGKGELFHHKRCQL